jgi:hypothetical protein
MTDSGPALSRSGLRRRGWTDAAIDRFLGFHDFEADNPHFAGGAPAKMYTLSRIEEAEKAEQFRAWKEGRDHRAFRSMSVGKDVPRQQSQTEEAQAKKPTQAGNAAETTRDSRRDGDNDDIETLADWLEGLP